MESQTLKKLHHKYDEMKGEASCMTMVGILSTAARHKEEVTEGSNRAICEDGKMVTPSPWQLQEWDPVGLLQMVEAVEVWDPDLLCLAVHHVSLLPQSFLGTEQFLLHQAP